METKYIFVTGGVVSSLGKGITAASLGRLLKSCGKKVVLQKFDPYINVDPGTMSPLQHGEVFVTEDGAETDLDVGHYERFVDINLNKDSDITTGIIYTTVLDKERNGEFGGATVQVIPHITNEIKNRVKKVATEEDVDIVITEIGGTVGDIEGLPFLEAIRQCRYDLGKENVLYIHVTLIPYLRKSGELKTKPTQHSVKELRGIGIAPDIIILRTEESLEKEQIEKIALFCNVEEEAVIENKDAETIYEIPLALDKQGLCDLTLKKLGLTYEKKDLREWENLIEKIKSTDKETDITLVVKYVDLKDAYISLYEAINHAGFYNGVKVNVNWVDAESVTPQNYIEKFKGTKGIIVPDGFGDRGFAGMILASKYARENDIAYFGMGMGMYAMAVDILRENGIEAIKDDSISKASLLNNDMVYAPRENGEKDDRRVGKFDLRIREGSTLREIYKNEIIGERHRNKYELNPLFEKYFNSLGILISGRSVEGDYIDAIEYSKKTWFIGVQYHPEFKSRPTRPHILFNSFVKEIIGRD